MSKDYAPLASIYERIGMASFAETLTPKLVQFAQSNDWVGRRILDVGCGTGASTRWLATKGYNTTALDSSPEMLAQARKRFRSTGFSITWQQGDLKLLDNIGQMDMILALDVLNELNGLREVETFLNRAYQLLDPGKVLIFDLHTIEGLLARAQRTVSYLHNAEYLAVVTEDQFDYERLILTTRCDIFQRDDEGDQWRRAQTTLTRRGFPIQAVAVLVQRIGFSIMALVTPNFEPFDPLSGRALRVIMIARKQTGAQPTGGAS